MLYFHGRRFADAATIRELFDPTDRYISCRQSRHACGPGALSSYTILGNCNEAILAGQRALRAVRRGEGAKEMDRAMGCTVGNVVGDALGAPMEFSVVRYGSTTLRGMDHDEVWQSHSYNSFNLKPGQWTDDASMGLCLADSLLVRGKFDPLDLRARFRLWNQYGYNNSFGRDPKRTYRGSIGLGGNISMSMWEFDERGTEYTRAGTKETSGNGSVMRNGPVATFFHSDVEAGMEAAYNQSKTTHQGEEAAECCRLLTYVCINFINGAGKELLDDLSGFTSPLYSVTCLRDSVDEAPHPENAHLKIKDRQWNWRHPEYRYCESRSRLQPTYIGSYAMDNLAMSLHCLYTTSSFEEATLKAANMCGDADSVCAVTAQMAGSLYGLSSIPSTWIDRVQRFDAGTVVARALQLYTHETSRLDPLSDAACATAQRAGEPYGLPSVDEPLPDQLGPCGILAEVDEQGGDDCLSADSLSEDTGDCSEIAEEGDQGPVIADVQEGSPQ